MTSRYHLAACCFLLLGLGSHCARAQQRNFDDVEVAAIQVVGNVYMLTGAGGNIGVSLGEDGVFLIDDQFAPLTEKILAALAELTEEPPQFVLNTHWHFDHTGGNENLGSAGIFIVAHENVRARMSVDQVMEAFGRTVPAAPPIALPDITFADAVTFHLNGETLSAFHVPSAHTDGDVLVHFESADVVHMGDVFFNGSYPFIDVGSGGTYDGVMAAVERILALTGESTRFIPGHGPLGGRDDLEAYLSMLSTVRDRVEAALDAGQDEAAILEAKLTADLDADWGGRPERGQSLVRVALVAIRGAGTASE